MKPNTTYAVVDIETTGTSVKDGDRIIQIGCAFVKNNKIINTFATDVNPLTTVPAVIENLTGISNARVRKAPPFDDLAGTVYSLLQGTVFVAHNVNFDLPSIQNCSVSVIQNYQFRPLILCLLAKFCYRLLRVFGCGT